jgi:hypothetical protein
MYQVMMMMMTVIEDGFNHLHPSQYRDNHCRQIYLARMVGLNSVILDRLEYRIMWAEGDDSDYSAEVFVYTGEGGAEVPHNVVRVRVDPSVTSIPEEAFFQSDDLIEVELCEGLMEIGVGSFACCNHSITKINIPNSLRRVGNFAFYSSLRTTIRLHDGIESIGKGAFAYCIFTNFRVPPLITSIPTDMLNGCRSMFSLEFPEHLSVVNEFALGGTFCLRNVAFPPNAVIDDSVFIDDNPDEDDDEINTATDLQLLFGSNTRAIRELMHRFDRLPIHKLVYYQSYHEGVLQILAAIINMRSCQSRTLRSKLDPTGNQQDCLGMTPLHILACSTVHDIDVYHLIIAKYPTNLITEDRWGALPLLYAFWGYAPAQIIEFLIESYQTLYPGYVFNWTLMMETIVRCDTPKESIENMLHVKQMHFPSQPIDWEYLLDKFVGYSLSNISSFGAKFLVMCGVSDRVEALAFKVWRDHITTMIRTAHFDREDSRDNLHRIRDKLAYFEGELPRLKEVTSILELALWKKRINENSSQQKSTRFKKRIKTDESSIRSQYRVSCGADIVISNVLPYLISFGYGTER